MNVAILFLASLRPLEPWWFLLLPVLLLVIFPNLIRLALTRPLAANFVAGRSIRGWCSCFLFVPALFPDKVLQFSAAWVRSGRWLAIGLRSFAFRFSHLAPWRKCRPANRTTASPVLFVWDRSLSIPADVQDGKDQREERILQFINDSVSLVAGGTRRTSSLGVIVFGKQSKLELPPGSVPKLGFRKIYSPLDRSYTDIAAAIKLALASFPEGAAKRIVLISDGNENMGHAAEHSRASPSKAACRSMSCPLPGNRNQQNEILLERIERQRGPKRIRALPIRVVVQQQSPVQVVVARVTLRKMRFAPGQDIRQGKDDDVEKDVKLAYGLNVYSFPQSGAKDDTFVHSYVATVVPLRVETEEGGDLVHKGLPGDRVDNNEARACVIARGERAILLLEPNAGDHRLLADRLRAAKAGLGRSCQ